MKNWKGRGRGYGLIEVISRHLLGGAEENDEKPQSGYQVSQPRFETSTSRIQQRYRYANSFGVLLRCVSNNQIRGLLFGPCEADWILVLGKPAIVLLGRKQNGSEAGEAYGVKTWLGVEKVCPNATLHMPNGMDTFSPIQENTTSMTEM
jgi:hypothetical protein